MKKKEQIEILAAALTSAALAFDEAEGEFANEIWKHWAAACARDAWAALREAEE